MGSLHDDLEFIVAQQRGQRTKTAGIISPFTKVRDAAPVQESSNALKYAAQALKDVSDDVSLCDVTYFVESFK